MADFGLMRWLAFLSSLLSLAAVCGAVPSIPEREPVGVVEGSLSTVALLEVSRPTAVELLEPVDGAPDGLIFYFLVIRKKPGTGSLHLEELRDFKVNSESYVSFTRTKVGLAFEPQTIAEDAADFFLRIRQDLQPLETLRQNREAYVVYTLIPGAKLPSPTRGFVTVRFGWGDRLESFSFNFRVSTPRRD